MRLIDADALKEHVKKYTSVFAKYDWREICEMLNDAPTVDAEPVVRCKDCVYCKRFNDVWRLPKRDELLCTLYVETYHTTENDYCSRGERKND